MMARDEQAMSVEPVGTARGYVDIQGGVYVTVLEVRTLGDDGILWARCADARGDWRWIEAELVQVLPPDAPTT